jgi:adenylate cyclase
MAEGCVSADDLAGKLERLREQQVVSGRVLRAVARGAGLQAVLDEVVEAAARLSGAPNGRLWLFSDRLLHVVANYGKREGYVYDSAPQLPDRSTMAGRTAVTRDVVHLPDVDADPEYSYAGPRPFRSGLHVPILLEDELIGVIGITRQEVGPFSDEQIELVKTFADQAAIAIANARLLEAVERQRTELSRFLSPQVAELVSSPGGQRLLAGHRAYITVLFCDLRGFTSFVETAEPEELLEVLRQYHGLMGELIPLHQGTLEHFAGDGMMVFFNDPAPVEEHELHAIRLALAAREGFADLAARWGKRGIDLGLGIGIAAGHATLGRIGFEGRYDYGALGPVTNLASRLSTQARAGQVLIGQRVFAAVDELVDARPIDAVELKGFARPIAVYEVIGRR